MCHKPGLVADVMFSSLALSIPGEVTRPCLNSLFPPPNLLLLLPMAEPHRLLGFLAVHWSGFQGTQKHRGVDLGR